MILALVTLILALPYCSAGKYPSQKAGGQVSVADVLVKKPKCPYIVEREKKFDRDLFSQEVGVTKSTSEVSAAKATDMKHHAESCKHCRENIIYGDEVSKSHVGERIKRISNVEWEKMK